MGYESVMCDMAGICRKADLDKLKAYSSALWMVASHYNYDESKIKNLLDKFNIFFDSGMDFKKLQWSIHHVLDDSCYNVVGDEVTVNDDTQGKHLYIDVCAWYNKNLFLEILEEMKGEF